MLPHLFPTFLDYAPHSHLYAIHEVNTFITLKGPCQIFWGAAKRTIQSSGCRQAGLSARILTHDSVNHRVLALTAASKNSRQLSSERRRSKGQSTSLYFRDQGTAELVNWTLSTIRPSKDFPGNHVIRVSALSSVVAPRILKFSLFGLGFSTN
jgi:hypothetical protein